MPNTNCLRGMQCACGNEGPFRITVRTVVEMHDDGSENLTGDLVFDNNDWCVCCRCGHAGLVSDFRREPIDRAPMLAPLIVSKALEVR